MIDPIAWHLWSYRLLYVVLALVIVLGRLLPLNMGAAGWPAPDILLALTLAWLLRQPAVVPMGLIVPVFLMADFLLHRPPGLLTLLVLLAAEWIKPRRGQLTDVNFLVEWISVTGIIFSLIILQRAALWLLAAPQSSLGLALVHGLVTVIAYPVVVLVSHYLLGLRKLGPADADTI